MNQLLIFLCLTSVLQLKGQELPFDPFEKKLFAFDSTQVYSSLKFSRNGEVQKASYSILNEVNGYACTTDYTYRSDKYGEHLMELSFPVDSQKLVLKYIRLVTYDSYGNVTRYEKRDCLTCERIVYKVEWYDNSNLKSIMVFGKNGFKLIDVIEYRLPDGSKFDYGSLRDGNGTIIQLDLDGSYCETYQVINGKIKRVKSSHSKIYQ